MQNGQRFDEFTPEQLRQLEARKWSDLLKDMDELRTDVREMKAVFQQAKGAVTFVKWAAAICAGVAGIAAYASQHITWKG